VRKVSEASEAQLAEAIGPKRARLVFAHFHP
jgi:hypothetical protein